MSDPEPVGWKVYGSPSASKPFAIIEAGDVDHPYYGLVSAPAAPEAASILDVQRGDILEVTRGGSSVTVRVTEVTPAGKHSVTITTEPAGVPT